MIAAEHISIPGTFPVLQGTTHATPWGVSIRTRTNGGERAGRGGAGRRGQGPLSVREQRKHQPRNALKRHQGSCNQSTLAAVTTQDPQTLTPSVHVSRQLLHLGQCSSLYRSLKPLKDQLSKPLSQFDL